MRTKRLAIRLSPAELDALRQAALRARLPISLFVRNVALTYVDYETGQHNPGARSANPISMPARPA